MERKAPPTTSSRGSKARLVDWLRDHRPPPPIVAEADREAGDDDDPPIEVRVYAGVAAYPYRAGRLGSALGAGAIGWGVTASVIAIGPLALAVAAVCGTGWYALVRRPGFRHVRYPTCTLRVDRDQLHARAAAIELAEIVDVVHGPGAGELRVTLRHGGDAIAWRGLREHADWIEQLVRAAIAR